MPVKKNLKLNPKLDSTSEKTVTDNVDVQESVVQETVVQESVVQETVVQETVVQESVVQDTTVQDTPEIVLETTEKTKKPRKSVTKKSTSTDEPEKTVNTTEVTEAPKTIVQMSNDKKVKKSKKQLKTTDDKLITDETNTTQNKPTKGTKKPKQSKDTKETKSTKKLKKSLVEKTPGESKEDTLVEEDDFKARSFKVKLPDDTEYKGRFTGLTPYQAANKALSKYFRNHENVNLTENNQILFSIKESTRGTNKKVYNYQGCRIKLETAISYTIKSADGTERIITKQYKNQLIKIKKNPTIINESSDEVEVETTITNTTEPVSALA